MSLAQLLGTELNAEFDYVKLLDLLKHFASPRDQITKLIKAQKIVRVKKGIYVLGPEFRKPFAHEILANMIYGPSYVSGHSALAFYGFIPERIEVTSSRTPNRHKAFDTPVGRFTYKYLPMWQYCVSISRVELDAERGFLIATREKVLVEFITEEKGIRSLSDLQAWMQSMRIDPEDLVSMRLRELTVLRKAFLMPQVDFLIELVRKVKK